MSNTQGWIARTLTALVALVAMLLSYHALALRAEVAGIPDPLAWVYPIAVDGLLGIGMLAAYVLRREPRLRKRAYVWGVISTGLGISLLGNALAGELRWDLIAIRAVPPIALALSLHLLVLLAKDERPRVARRAAERSPEPAPPALAPEVPLARPLVLEPNPSRSASSIALELLSADPSMATDQVRAATGLSPSSVRRLRSQASAKNGRAESAISG